MQFSGEEHATPLKMLGKGSSRAIGLGRYCYSNTCYQQRERWRLDVNQAARSYNAQRTSFGQEQQHVRHHKEVEDCRQHHVDRDRLPACLTQPRGVFIQQTNARTTDSCISSGVTFNKYNPGSCVWHSDYRCANNSKIPMSGTSDIYLSRLPDGGVDQKEAPLNYSCPHQMHRHHGPHV